MVSASKVRYLGFFSGFLDFSSAAPMALPSFGSLLSDRMRRISFASDCTLRTLCSDMSFSLALLSAFANVDKWGLLDECLSGGGGTFFAGWLSTPFEPGGEVDEGTFVAAVDDEMEEDKDCVRTLSRIFGRTSGCLSLDSFSPALPLPGRLRALESGASSSTWLGLQ